MSNIQTIENDYITTFNESITKDITKAVDLKNDSQKYKTPGIEILIANKGNILINEAFGIQSIEEPEKKLKKGLAYDLGSLSQIICTTTILMKLQEQNLVDINSRVSRILQSFGSAGKETMKVHHLLSHTSGFKATIPAHRMIIKGQANLHSLMTRRAALHILYNEIYRTRLSNVPGKIHQISDIGFILLGAIAEVATGITLNKLFTEMVSRPFKLSSTGFIDLEQIRRRTLTLENSLVVPTFYCPWRKKRIHGEASDEIAWSIGGIASHSGLFGNSDDLSRFATNIIDSYHGRPSPIKQETTRKFLAADPNTNPDSNESLHTLGWQTFKCNGKYSLFGIWSPTGTGMWIEPETETIILLLSNSTQIEPKNHQVIQNIFKSTILPALEKANILNEE